MAVFFILNADTANYYVITYITDMTHVLCCTNITTICLHEQEKVVSMMSPTFEGLSPFYTNYTDAILGWSTFSCGLLFGFLSACSHQAV